MTAHKTERLKSIVEPIVREKIRSGDIVDVRVNGGEDADGDDIIVVNVVFEGRLDPIETAQLTRFVRNELLAIDDRRFPHTSYISKTEAGNRAAA